MTRYRLTIQYDGTDFHGWQKQEPPGRDPLRTVQAVLEDAVRRALRQPLVITGASRTDAGVHALGQVASFDAETTIPIERIPAAVNKWLPADVAVSDAAMAPSDFDPISGPISKAYQYTIHNSHRRAIFDRQYVTPFAWLLDADLMNEAASHLVGTHDFTAMANINHGKESAVRTIHDCRVIRRGDRILIDVAGSGFLYHMVRIIAGTLMFVGRRRIGPGDIPGLLASRDRSRAGPTMGAAGLCLMWIRYPGDPDPQPPRVIS